MKSFKSLFVLSTIIALCVFGSGCAAQIAVGVLQGVAGLAPSDLSLSGDDSPRLAQFSDKDTKEMILKRLGKPNLAVPIDNNAEVLAYTDHTIYRMFAVKDGKFQDKKIYQKELADMEMKAGTLPGKLKSYFPCFQTMASPTISPPTQSVIPSSSPPEPKKIPSSSLR